MKRRHALPPKAAAPLAMPTVSPSAIRAEYPQLTRGRARLYVLLTIWVAGWTTVHMFFARTVFSNDLLWLQYYVIDYKSGFVRRGLAGELAPKFRSGGHPFAAAYAALWASVVVWLLAIAVLMWVIAFSGIRSERKFMLALVVPVLPFAFSYGVYSPHPELFGMTALLVLGVSLTTLRSPRSRMLLSALYGLVVAVLALMHEAIPLALALGATLAIVVLAKDARPAVQRICAAAAVGPGLVALVVVAALGRRDAAAQLCAQMPHGLVDDPWTVATSPRAALDYMLGHIESRVDYHDWVCQRVTPTFNAGLVNGVQAVILWGFVPLVGAFVLGLLYFVGSTWAIRYVSGVPVRAFLDELRGNLLLPALGSALVALLFVTAVDWTRWWILITFDVAVVYLLYAIGRPEVEQAPTRRGVVIFAWYFAALAVIPLGCANNIGTF